MIETMAETKLRITGNNEQGEPVTIVVTIPDNPFASLDMPAEQLIMLLSRDAYTPMLAAAPTADTLTYYDEDLQSDNSFHTGQTAIYPDASEEDGYGVSMFIAQVDGKAIWRKLGSTTAELPMDIYLTGATEYSDSCQIIKEGILE